jgi:hypothetical protein
MIGIVFRFSDQNPEFPKQSRADIGLRAESGWRTSLRSRFGQTVSDKLALCQFGRVFHTRLEIFSAAGMQELNYLQRDPEFVAEAEKTRMTLNPIPGTALHSMIIEGLSMPAALKEKLKPILAPKG